MKTLFLIRHGQSEANVNKQIYFQADLYDQHIQLTNTGRKQAAAAGKKLGTMFTGKAYTAFVSPYTRATETLDGVTAALGISPSELVVDGRLREQEFKVFKDMDDYIAKNERRAKRGKLYYRFKNAESGYDVVNRVSNFYNQLRLDWLLGNREDTILIVCHDLVIRAFLLIALDLPPEDFERIWVDNCEIFQLSADDSLKFKLETELRRSNP